MKFFSRFFPKKAAAEEQRNERLNPAGPEGQPRNEAQMAALEAAIENIGTRVKDAREKTQAAFIANMAVFDNFEALVQQRKREMGGGANAGVADQNK